MHMQQFKNDVILEPVVQWKINEYLTWWLASENGQAYVNDVINKVKNRELVDGKLKVEDTTSEAPPYSRSPPPLAIASPRSPRGKRLSEKKRTHSTTKTAVSRESRLITSQSVEEIPRFYFPFGQSHLDEQSCSLLKENIQSYFNTLSRGRAHIGDMNVLTKLCDCPLYWRVPLFQKANINGQVYITAEQFIFMWTGIIERNHDEESRFVALLSKSNRKHLLPQDFEPLLQDVVNSHPGLAFLQEAKEFHTRYVMTVTGRIFYTVNRSWSGKITAEELRRSCLLNTIALLGEEDDINKITHFFSYEHFYVIYCKFWELDSDRDLAIDRQDLYRHDMHSVSERAINRIFQGSVSRTIKKLTDKMNYNDFIWFIISEEDKRTPTSIEYWFRVMDLDGDGALSMYEMQHFWDEQVQRMLRQDYTEILMFEDILCEMMDLVKPVHPDYITLGDLKNCKLSHVFFNTFLNFKKFLDYQNRESIGASKSDEEMGEFLASDWEKYAAEEYEILVAEEGIQDSYASYEDDFDVIDSQKKSLQPHANGVVIEKLDLQSLVQD